MAPFHLKSLDQTFGTQPYSCSYCDVRLGEGREHGGHAVDRPAPDVARRPLRVLPLRIFLG
eukprot:8343328-Heterocapsa_arctica.AAC.1